LSPARRFPCGARRWVAAKAVVSEQETMRRPESARCGGEASAVTIDVSTNPRPCGKWQMGRPAATQWLPMCFPISLERWADPNLITQLFEMLSPATEIWSKLLLAYQRVHFLPESFLLECCARKPGLSHLISVRLGVVGVARVRLCSLVGTCLKGRLTGARRVSG
jgi:hypothetical protein